MAGVPPSYARSSASSSPLVLPSYNCALQYWVRRQATQIALQSHYIVYC
jgi:hypothetical protein